MIDTGIGTLASGHRFLAMCNDGPFNASLTDLFNRCAFPPGFGDVAVPGTSFSQDVAVPSSFTTVLGTAVDCTQARSCQIGLVRLEPDATVSSALTPLTFG